MRFEKYKTRAHTHICMPIKNQSNNIKINKQKTNEIFQYQNRRTN